MQPILQDRIAIPRIAALAAIDLEPDLRSMPDSIAQCLQPAERGLFGVQLGEAGGYGLSGDGSGGAPRSALKFACSSGSLSSIRRHTVS